MSDERELAMEELMDDDEAELDSPHYVSPLSAELAARGFTRENRRRELVREWWEVHFEVLGSLSGEWYGVAPKTHDEKAEAVKSAKSMRLQTYHYRSIRLVHVRRYRKVKP